MYIYIKEMTTASQKFEMAHPNYFKEYRVKNYDKLSQYYVNHKDKFYRTVECECCGKSMLKANVKRHQKSKLCAKSALMREQVHQEMQTAHEVEELPSCSLTPPLLEPTHHSLQVVHI